MTRVSLLPHRCAVEGVLATPWTLRTGGVDVAPADVAIAWDRVTPLELRSEVTVEPTEIWQQCGLDAAAPLALVSSWHSRGTNIRRVVARVPLERAASHTIVFTIDAAEAAEELVLDRRVVLDRAHPNDDPLVASAAGSILWRDSPAQRLVVQLDAPAEHLSIEAIDFSAHDDLDADAAWAIDVDVDDLDADGRAALRLIVNTTHPAIAGLVEGDDRDRREQVASVLRWDVARTVLGEVLTDERFVERFGELAPGSVGGFVQALIEGRWPDESAHTLLDRRDASRANFDAEVQARFGLLRRT